MSARLIGELTNWLMSPAAQAMDLSPAERNVLFVVAERSHEKTRVMLRHRGDDMQLVDRIALATGLSRDGALKKALQRLARRDLDVRIPVAKGKDGRPVFAYEGHSMRFRLPQFPASVSIPERPADPVDDGPAPVDNPADGAPREDAAVAERGDQTSRLSARGGTKRPASGDERGDQTSRPTPSKYISGPSYKLDPSTSVRSPVAEVEGGTAERDGTIKIPWFDFRSALIAILQAPPEVQAAASARAAEELGPDATNEALRIRAAEIASEGIAA
ncbi:hypothetical protein OHR68_09835 [Spirillospora sp. NBC_00431]